MGIWTFWDIRGPKSVGFVPRISIRSTWTNFLCNTATAKQSPYRSDRQADTRCYPSDHAGRMDKRDVWGGTVHKGLGNTWHVHAGTIFVIAVIHSDMHNIWLMAETWKSHRRINSPFHVFAPVCLESLGNHKTQRPRGSLTDVPLSCYLFHFSFFLMSFEDICQPCKWTVASKEQHC